MSTKFKKGHKHSDEIKKKISDTLKRKNIKPLQRFHAIGEDHPSWKGGMVKDSNGYVMIKKRGHHRGTKQDYVKRSVLVAEKKIGRLLKDNEVVHHLDFNKENDNPNNLLVIDRIEHVSLHHTLRKREKERIIWRKNYED